MTNHERAMVRRARKHKRIERQRTERARRYKARPHDVDEALPLPRQRG